MVIICPTHFTVLSLVFHQTQTKDYETKFSTKLRKKGHFDEFALMVPTPLVGGGTIYSNEFFC